MLSGVKDGAGGIKLRDPEESLSLAGIGPQLHRCGFTQTQMGFCSAVGDSLTVGGITSTTNPEL